MPRAEDVLNSGRIHVMRAYPGPMRAVSMSPTPVSRYTGGGDRAASQNPPSVYPTKSETQLYLELERVKAELEQIRTRSSEQRARSTSTGSKHSQVRVTPWPGDPSIA